MTPAWYPIQKFQKSEQARALFVSQELSGFKQYFTERKRGQLEDKLDNLQKPTTPFQKCSQSYLNLSLCFLLRQLLGQLSALHLRQYDLIHSLLLLSPRVRLIGCAYSAQW